MSVRLLRSEPLAELEQTYCSFKEIATNSEGVVRAWNAVIPILEAMYGGYYQLAAVDEIDAMQACKTISNLLGESVDVQIVSIERDGVPVSYTTLRDVQRVRQIVSGIIPIRCTDSEQGLINVFKETSPEKRGDMGKRTVALMEQSRIACESGNITLAPDQNAEFDVMLYEITGQVLQTHESRCHGATDILHGLVSTFSKSVKTPFSSLHNTILIGDDLCERLEGTLLTALLSILCIGLYDAGEHLDRWISLLTLVERGAIPIGRAHSNQNTIIIMIA